MTPHQIIEQLKPEFGTQIREAAPASKHPRIHVAAASWPRLALYLRNTPGLEFDWLANLSGIDYAADNQLCVAYDLWSFSLRHAFAVKVYCPRDNPVVASVVELWPAADWHEREAFDLLGIRFIGHPDLRRILCADDWEGHPLRKDYVFPREYHGIPGSVELDWTQES